MYSTNKSIFAAALILSAFAMSGCGSETTAKAITQVNTGTSTGTGTGPGGSGVVPFSVNVQTSWEVSDTLLTTWTGDPLPCSIPAGTIPGSAGATQTCYIYIPEGQLYFSKLHLSVTTDSEDDCAIMDIHPYYYRQSNAAGFKQYGNSTNPAIDCSVSPAPATCYNGPGTTIANFPAYDGTYFLSSLGLTQGPPAPFASANSFNPTSAPKFTNTWLANNLATAARFTNIASGSVGGNGIGMNNRDSYVSGSMHDYQFNCIDRWNQPLYRIYLVISDDPVPSGFVAPPGYVASPQRSAWYSY